MRILAPGYEPDNESQRRNNGAAEWILNITIPFALIKERFFMRLVVGIDPKTENGSDGTGSRTRVFNRMIILMVFGIVVVTCVAGIIFLIYLIKSLAGIDIFPKEHLL